MNGRENTLNAVFGEGNWDYWTRDVMGVDGLTEKLEEYNQSGQSVMIMGVFDLSSANSIVTNHMVGISGVAGEDGTFSVENIVPTSNGDRNRLSSSTQRAAYNMDNLKEIRIVFLEEEPKTEEMPEVDYENIQNIKED